ncbi:membrane protein [Streptomyces litmocidini]|nr:membrane protein [Streptomyces litmocidini]
MLPVLFLLCGSLAAAGSISDGKPVGTAVLLLLFVLLAVAHSPLVFPRTTEASEAQRLSAADGRPIVYWRPGCKYCLRLRLRLGRRARQFYWVDIWRDPAGAAVVRAANGGDETVPTVVVSGRPFVNPDPAWVRERLSPSA